MANSILQSPIIPGMPPATRDQHRRYMSIAIIVIVLSIIVLLFYWFSGSAPEEQTNTPVVDQQAQMRAEIISKLNSTPSELTQAQMNAIKKELSKSKVTISEDQKAKIIQQLNAK